MNALDSSRIDGAVVPLTVVVTIAQVCVIQIAANIYQYLHAQTYLQLCTQSKSATSLSERRGHLLADRRII